MERYKIKIIERFKNRLPLRLYMALILQVTRLFQWAAGLGIAFADLNGSVQKVIKNQKDLASQWIVTTSSA
jgi:hypothetical protein